jgi:leader peptidase (prepilin peptidase)/N-methyltransferase
VSFLALRGRCRTCGANIPRRYLLLEAAALMIAVWSVLLFDGPLALWSALLGFQLLLLGMLDAEHFWLPRALTIPLTLTGLSVAGALGPDRLAHNAIGAAAGFAALALLAAGYKRLRGRDGLGRGDAYLLAGGGAWVGWASLPLTLVIAAIAGLAAAGLAALAGRPIRSDQPLPFGVFLALGIWLVWLYGPFAAGGSWP